MLGVGVIKMALEAIVVSMLHQVKDKTFHNNMLYHIVVVRLLFYIGNNQSARTVAYSIYSVPSMFETT